MRKNSTKDSKAIKSFEKRIQKEMLKGIVFGTIKKYAVVSREIPLAEIIKCPFGVVEIQLQYNAIKKKLKGSDKILNTNLEELGIRI